MTGIDAVAQVAFVRKRTVEVQYLRATITDEQRTQFETLVEDTVRGVESGLFLPHSGIRFPPEPMRHLSFRWALPRTLLMIGASHAALLAHVASN